MYKSNYEEGPLDCEREAPQWFGFTISDAIERAIGEKPEDLELNLIRGNMEHIIGKMSRGVYEAKSDFHCEKLKDKYKSRYVFVFVMENCNYNLVFEALVTTTKEPPKELAEYKPFNHFWTKEGERRQKNLDRAGEIYARQKYDMEQYEENRNIERMERLNNIPEIKRLNERRVYNNISGIYKIHPEQAISDNLEYEKEIKKAKQDYNI